MALPASRIPTFDEYVNSLGRLTEHLNPLTPTRDTVEVEDAAATLAHLPSVTIETLSEWVASHPAQVYVLGLVVGIGRERLKNILRHRMGSSGWFGLAKQQPVELVTVLDTEFDLVRSLSVQRVRTCKLADILNARASGRQVAASSGLSGRSVEDRIEGVARDLGLHYETRTRFVGRQGRTAPCDLVVPSGEDALIGVAAKGFDSTGSKLTDAVREIEEMADVRHARQYVMAVIDGIGWKSGQADLRRLHALWSTGAIDGMYTLATLDRFREDLAEAARLRGLLPSTQS